MYYVMMFAGYWWIRYVRFGRIGEGFGYGPYGYHEAHEICDQMNHKAGYTEGE